LWLLYLLIFLQVLGEICGNGHPIQAVEVMESKKTLFCGTSANLLKSATVTDDKLMIDDVQSEAIIN